MKNFKKALASFVTHCQNLPLFKAVIIAFLMIIFTTVNAITLAHNFALHAANTKLVETAQTYYAQADYIKDCQLITEFVSELSPPLINFPDETGNEYLYYCTDIKVERDYFDSNSSHAWHISKDGEKFESERIELPNYDDCLDQTYYHAYYHTSSYSGKAYYLETHQIHQLGDTYYIIECEYERVPTSINVDDPNEIAYFLAKQNNPSFSLFYMPLPQSSSTQIEIIDQDNQNIIYSTPEENNCGCGCSGCTCSNCQCES